MTAPTTHRHQASPGGRRTRIDLWSVALLFMAIVWLTTAFYFMVANRSSPLFLAPAVAVAMYAIINLRE